MENNYWGNMEMLNKNFKMFDSIELIDTSNSIMPVCKLSLGKIVSSVSYDQIPTWLKAGMSEIYKVIEVFNNSRG